jgi:hypothetical protein
MLLLSRYNRQKDQSFVFILNPLVSALGDLTSSKKHGSSGVVDPDPGFTAFLTR